VRICINIYTRCILCDEDSELVSGLLLLIVSISLLLLGSLNHVDGVKHDCIPPTGNDNLSSMIASNSTNLTQIDQINNRIMELVSPANMTLVVTNETTNTNETTIGNPEEITSAIRDIINKETNLNAVQVNALQKMIDYAIIVEEAQLDPLAPKPNITFKLSSSNQTYTITC
jgi:hypothetical protein